jgi:hypothetical protein
MYVRYIGESEGGLTHGNHYSAVVAHDGTIQVTNDDGEAFFYRSNNFKVAEPSELSEPLDTQVGGSHYKTLKIQPVEYIHANNISYFEGCVIKYVTRWRNKNGIEDLKKAKHFIELLIELEGKE